MCDCKIIACERLGYIITNSNVAKVPKKIKPIMQHQSVIQILAALDGDHNATIYDLVVQTLRSQQSSHIRHQRSIVDQIPDLLDLLSERASSQLASSVVKAASSTYESELQNLISKQNGFHFSGNTAGLSQLEDFSITQMGRKIQDLAPNLWTLLGSLLDVEPDRRRTAPAEEILDEDTEMELADIATAVDGNDDGSDELEDEDVEGEMPVEGAAAASSLNKGATSDDDLAADSEMQQPADTVKKRHYKKQNRARRNAALMYIVSTDK
jgi:hypothetical protein